MKKIITLVMLVTVLSLIIGCGKAPDVIEDKAVQAEPDTTEEAEVAEISADIEDISADIEADLGLDELADLGADLDLI